MRGSLKESFKDRPRCPCSWLGEDHAEVRHVAWIRSHYPRVTPLVAVLFQPTTPQPCPWHPPACLATYSEIYCILPEGTPPFGAQDGRKGRAFGEADQRCGRWHRAGVNIPGHERCTRRTPLCSTFPVECPSTTRTLGTRRARADPQRPRHGSQRSKVHSAEPSRCHWTAGAFSLTQIFAPQTPLHCLEMTSLRLCRR